MAAAFFIRSQMMDLVISGFIKASWPFLTFLNLLETIEHKQILFNKIWVFLKKRGVCTWVNVKTGNTIF